MDPSQFQAPCTERGVSQKGPKSVEYFTKNESFRNIYYMEKATIKHIPYTYRIGWTSLNLYYYGVRFSANCHPNDLWKKYFTSSDLVHNTRKSHGEPDIIEVRKTFTTADRAILWEHKVLKRLRVHNNSQWLNINYGTATKPRQHSQSYLIVNPIEKSLRDPNWIPHYLINSFLK